MTINEKYLHMLLPCLAAAVEGGKVTHHHKDGKYTFPCPFCTMHTKKDYKKRQQCAALLPHKDSFGYTFHCCRGKSSQCSNSMSFPNFLKTYNPPLYKRYHLEREVAGTTGKGHNIGSYFRGDK
jgi:hypothetical protein